MVITRTSFAIFLLFSLATIATADYLSPVYTSPAQKPTFSPPVHTPPVNKHTLSPPVYAPPTHKPTFPPPVYTPPFHKPTLPPPFYTPPVYKPTLPPPVYSPPMHKPTLSPPTYKPTQSPPVYTKPTLPSPIYTPPVDKPTLPPPVYTPPVYKPTLSPPVYTNPTTPPTKHYIPNIIGAIDGIILCKNGYETYPIQGAKAMIVCSEQESYGKNKNEVVIYSDPTDSKGYFHVALTHIKDLFQCRVKLYTSPVKTCNNPTNVNKGLTGVLLSTYSEKNLKFFNVGPFYFTGSKAVPSTPRY